jgi:hypothetical protein
MTTTPKTFDHDLKLKRAREHFDNMKVEIERWLRGNYYTVRYQLEPDGRTIILATAEQPPPDPISLLIGDCLHNMRSALDVLAYSLAVEYARRNGKPLAPEIAQSSEFPIFGDEDRKGTPNMGPALFKNSGLLKIGGIDPQAQTIIEGLQPYKRGNAFRTDPLWTLHDLDNVNKHRLLHSAVGTSEGFTIDVGKSFNLQIKPPLIESWGGPIKTNTPVARFNLGPVDPALPMNMQINPAITDIAFADAPVGIPDESVIKSLADIHNHIVGKVLPPLVGFL